MPFVVTSHSIHAYLTFALQYTHSPLVNDAEHVTAAEMIIINGRGIVQYNFEATVDEELTVDRGEQVIFIYLWSSAWCHTHTHNDVLFLHPPYAGLLHPFACLLSGPMQ